MMTTYTINVRETDDAYAEFKYMANFDDYDGAEDGNNALGHGDTHHEAIQDLIDQYAFEDEQ